MNAPTPNHPALEFLCHLDGAPGAKFNIEHYTDLPKGKPKLKPDPMGGQYADLSIEDVKKLLPILHEINERGAGIFVARNECSGPRSAKAVSRVRGVHADMDDATADQVASISQRLEPSIRVHTSGGTKCHFYWQLGDGEALTPEEAKAINQTLVNYGADPAAVDASRLLRVPGFKHMKYRANGITPIVTGEYLGKVYTASEIRDVFPPKMDEIMATEPSGPKASARKIETDLYDTLIDEVSAEVRSRHKDLWGGDWESAPRPNGIKGYPSQSEADLALAGYIARACQGRGVAAADLAPVVDAVFGRSALGMSDKWLARVDYRDRTISRAMRNLGAIGASNGPPVCLLESHGDVLNARAFANLARGELLFVPTRGRWFRWHRGRWYPCEMDEPIAKAKEVCGRILDAASEVLKHDQERGKRLVHEAVNSHKLARITAMVKLAVSEPGMAVSDRDLDADPFLLGVENGVVDLRSGNLLVNEPGMHITRYCNAAYDGTTNCSRWLEFLDQIFEGDLETIDCVQRLLGYTLLGLATEEVLVICFGHGSNGKSVFSNVIHKIIGGYAVMAPSSLLASRKANDSAPRNDVAALAGARYVSINEMQAGDRLDEQVVKAIAGREPIAARFLHQEFFEFSPSFTPWLRTNHKPIITGQDHGIWRRLVLLRFGRTFSDAERDPDLENRLLSERNGILRWMVAGALMYLKDGLKLSPRMKAEWASYREESDLLGEYLIDRTVATPTGKTDQKSLYGDYRIWCSECGVRPLSKKSFTQRLLERGYRSDSKSGATRYYTGLALRDSYHFRADWAPFKPVEEVRL